MILFISNFSFLIRNDLRGVNSQEWSWMPRMGFRVSARHLNAYERFRYVHFSEDRITDSVTVLNCLCPTQYESLTYGHLVLKDGQYFPLYLLLFVLFFCCFVLLLLFCLCFLSASPNPFWSKVEKCTMTLVNI